MGRNLQNYVLLDAKAATGAGTTINVEDYEHIVISVATDGGGTANLTVKFTGSIETSAPTFSSAQVVDNMYEYIQAIDLQNGTATDGDTGFSVAGADDYKMYALNVDGLKWLTAVVTGYTAGAVTVKCKLFNNK